jgi:hypothetical protein
VLSVIIHIDGKNTQALYNSACYYALLKNKNKTLEYLQKVIAIEPLKYRKLAETDPDFENYRKDSDFNKLIGPAEA